MAAHESLSDAPEQRLNRKRFIFLAGSLVILLIASTFFSASNSASDSAKVKAAAVGMLNAPNLVKNPPYTFGPKCSMNVAIALDRSGSANPYANQLKGTLKGFYDLLHARTEAIPTGGSANVFLDAFGTYSVRQNGPPPGSSAEENWFWFSKFDISREENLEWQKKIVDEVYYDGRQTHPFPDGRPDQAYKGFFGGSYTDFSPFRISNAGASGTNYDAALTSLAHQIGFWTGNNPALRGDEDFDMVLIISDGVPTKSYGADHLPQFQENDLRDPNPYYPGPESWGNSADPNDIKYARQAVNTLRTGSAIRNEETGVPADIPYMGVRPPVPVIGILAGATWNDPVAMDNMRSIYGDGNWYGTSNFTTELSAALEAAIEDVGCFGDVKEEVEPQFSVTATPESQVLAEFAPGTINLEIENTGSIPVDITELEIRGPGDNYTEAWGMDPPTVVTFSPPLRVNPGNTITHPLNVSGVPGGERFYHYGIFGKGIIDSATQECTGGEGDDPCVVWRESRARVATIPTAYPS